MKILVLVHRIFTPTGIKPGGIDYVTSFLENKGMDVIFIEHPLSGSHNSRIKEGSSSKEYRLPFAGLFRWPCEIIFTIIKARQYKHISLIIAVDPLNFLSAYILRALNGSPIQFYAVDFSEKRFGVGVLDAIYRKLYYFAVSHSNFVTYVGINMRNFILPLAKSPTFTMFLPNSPEFDKAPKMKPLAKNPCEVVYIKSDISRTEISMLVELTSLLKENYQEIKVHVVGKYPPASMEILAESALQNHLLLHGLLEYNESLEIMSRSYIGIAWYENVRSFEKYADSLKIREYAASGLPVVCNKNISTALDAEKNGLLLLCEDVGELSRNIKKLISDVELYRKMRNRALEWAKENDKYPLLDKLYRRVGLI